MIGESPILPFFSFLTYVCTFYHSLLVSICYPSFFLLCFVFLPPLTLFYTSLCLPTFLWLSYFPITLSSLLSPLLPFLGIILFNSFPSQTYLLQSLPFTTHFLLPTFFPLSLGKTEISSVC